MNKVFLYVEERLVPLRQKFPGNVVCVFIFFLDGENIDEVHSVKQLRS